MILAYLPSLLLSLVALYDATLECKMPHDLRTEYKAHLFYVVVMRLFIANSRSLAERMLARHFHVAISWTKSLVSNIFLRLGWAGATNREEKY